MSSSNSRSRNFRRRADEDGDDEDEKREPQTSSTPLTAATSAAKSLPKPSSTAKPKKSHTQIPKLLSFADDEDNATPPPRSSSSSKHSNSDRFSSRLSKPSSSHKITPLKDRLPHSSSSSTSFLPSNVQPQAGTYTKETLRELQKNTRTLASSSRPASESKPSSQPIVVLKGLVKPTDQIKESGHEDGEDSLFQSDKDEAEARLASMGINKGNDSSGSLIPDQATINAIRAKRERLRQSRAAAPDYISLDGGSNHGAAEGLSDEEPEFQGRIALFEDKLDTAKKGVFEEVDEKTRDGVLVKEDGNENDDEDEEEKIWEEEQFRKGLGKRMEDGSKNGGVIDSVSLPQNAKKQSFVYPEISGSIGGVIGASGSLDVMSVSQQAETARNALQLNMRRLKESHGRTMTLLTRTDENLSASLLNISDLEKSVTAAGEKFIFMQKLRDFVSVICEFLQHKAPFIEELEEQMQKLHEDRASAILERRSADTEDEMIEIEAAVKAAMSILGKKGNSPETISAATSAAQAASTAAREQTNLPSKLDEFGRDLNLQKRMEMKKRAEGRQRRKAQFDSKRMSAMEVDSSHQRIEGESSTDESDSESASYESNRDLLLQTADQIFSDASEEYSQLSVVKERFEEWKKDHSSSYRDAYMSLSIPAIFSPYVRLELLKWDPLHEDSDFFDMKWHSLLFNYGMPEDESELAPNDADANLVPGLVEKVALPILHHQISHCWDILSTRETKNAVSATSLVTNYVPASSESLAELLLSVRTRLANAVSNLTVPTWSPIVLKAVPNAASVAAYQFGMSVRLMRNICLWKEILAKPVLEKLALDELLCGKIIPHLWSVVANVHDAMIRTERVIASLSGVWAGPSVTGESSGKLQPLVEYVMSVGKTLEKKHASGVPESETNGLARRLKKMLVELNQYDSARNIARTFHLKEAL